MLDKWPLTRGHTPRACGGPGVHVPGRAIPYLPRGDSDDLNALRTAERPSNPDFPSDRPPWTYWQISHQSHTTAHWTVTGERPVP